MQAQRVAADEPATHRIRVVYDGPDLDVVASAIGRTRTATIALHAEQAYRVAMLGLSALRLRLPHWSARKRLRLPRRAPRPRVEPGSVGIAAQYTGIYLPTPSAGGWNLLGRARSGSRRSSRGGQRLQIDDAAVQFVPTAESGRRASAPLFARASRFAGRSFPPPQHRRPRSAPRADAGGRSRAPRRWRASRPDARRRPSRRTARSLFSLRARNALAGNASGACAVELTGTLEAIARGGRVTVADEHRRIELAVEGDRHRHLQRRRRARHLPGSRLRRRIEAPLVLGSRGALLRRRHRRPPW